MTCLKHKVRGIAVLAEKLLASQERLFHVVDLLLRSVWDVTQRH